MQPVILVHGGAGNISDDSKAQALVDGVKTAAKIGHATLGKTGNIVDAVEAAVIYMENEKIFNAGLGSVLNLDGEVEMDASIMIGSDLSAGAVTVVKDIQNPISLARTVMEKTSHVLLAGAGATRFAVTQGFSLLKPGDLVTDETLEALNKLKNENLHNIAPELGTVGAVGIDENGRLAAATSTGGRAGKLPGRSSDTCMIGSGTYADDTIGAVSTTGHGETIAKFCLAHAIVKRMEAGETAFNATNNCIEAMTLKLNNTAGAITLSNKGEVGVGFSSNRMSWAYQKGNQLFFGIDKNQELVETV